MTRALVLGGNGQDGTYLIRHLLARGFDVVGVGSRTVPRFHHAHARYRYARVDLRTTNDLAALLDETQPDRIFHFAAVHASAGASYEKLFADMLRVNVESVHATLEHLRARRTGRLLYASSAKAFGEPLPASIDELTPLRSTCLYGVTKNAASALIAHYRSQHAVTASVVYLFNHESPHRPPEYFVPKLVRALELASGHGEGERARFFTLDFYCDWGSAEEYTDIAVDILERSPGEDVVLATGRCVHARELVAAVFSARGLDWTDFIEEAGVDEPSRPQPYVADISKLARLLGRTPERTIEQVIEEMLATKLATG